MKFWSRNRKRRICYLVAGAMIVSVGGFHLPKISLADHEQDISDARKRIEDYQNASAEVRQLLEQMQASEQSTRQTIQEMDELQVEISKHLSEVNGEIDALDEKIAKTERELEDARNREKSQYDSMKVRIRYMYEFEETSYLDIFLGEGSIEQMLNRIVYISQVSAYDRKKLDEYDQVQKEIQEKVSELEVQQNVLSLKKSEYENNMSAVEGILTAKSQELDQLSQEIAASQKEITKYTEDIDQENRRIAEIELQMEKEAEAAKIAAQKAAEAARKAAEEARRKAAEAAKKAAEEASKKAAEEASRKAAEEASRKASEEASRKASEEASVKASVEESIRISEEESIQESIRESEREASGQDQPTESEPEVEPSTEGKTPAETESQTPEETQPTTPEETTPQTPAETQPQPQVGTNDDAGDNPGAEFVFTWPAPESIYISSVFGPRPNLPVAGVSPFHNAIDLAAPHGSPILAAADGIVIYAGDGAEVNSTSGGYQVWIYHPEYDIITMYMHSSELLVAKDDYVTAGMQIAKVGSTGLSAGDHLDFRILVTDTYIDPLGSRVSYRNARRWYP